MTNGEILRNDGIAAVLNNESDDWKTKAREWSHYYIWSLPVGAYFTGEDVRLFTQEKAGSPRHHNAWGGLLRGTLNSALSDDIIELDGLAKASQKSAHARLYPRYRIVR